MRPSSPFWLPRLPRPLRSRLPGAPAPASLAPHQPPACPSSPCRLRELILDVFLDARLSEAEAEACVMPGGGQRSSLGARRARLPGWPLLTTRSPPPPPKHTASLHLCRRQRQRRRTGCVAPQRLRDQHRHTVQRALAPVHGHRALGLRRRDGQGGGALLLFVSLLVLAMCLVMTVSCLFDVCACAANLLCKILITTGLQPSQLQPC